MTGSMTGSLRRGLTGSRFRRILDGWRGGDFGAGFKRGAGDVPAPGLKRGGVLNVVQHELEIVCDAANIPDEIHVSLEGLEIGDSIHISQVPLPDGVLPANRDEDFTVATVVAPSAMKSEEETSAPASEVPTVAGAASTGGSDDSAQGESGNR